MRVRLTSPQKTHEGDDLPPGTLIEHEDTHYLVGMGMAEPADDECRAKVAEMAKRHKGYRGRPKAKIILPSQQVVSPAAVISKPEPTAEVLPPELPTADVAGTADAAPEPRPSE